MSSWAQTAEPWGLKEQSSTSLPELQSRLSQRHFQRQLPGQRMQLDTTAAQHSADNQWRKGEMWQKWLERILSSGDLAQWGSLSRKSQSSTMCSLSIWEKQACELMLLPSVLWIWKQLDSNPHCFSYLSAPLHRVPGSGCSSVWDGWDSLRQ